MKKYLLGIIAVVMAIGFSAFTTVKKQGNTFFGSYYWYPIANGEISGPKLNATTVNKVTAMNTPSITTCEDNDAPLCVAGSSNPNLDLHDDIPASQGDNFINHTE